jgi:hypothetical protein
VSTSAVDTWRAVKIRTGNLTEVPNGFLPLIQVPPMIPNKTEVLNLKTRKIQVPIGYLSLSLIYESFCVSNVSNHAYLWLGWKMALCLKKK